MTEYSVDVSAVPCGDEVTSKCSCCGRPVYKGCGELHSDEKCIADYWYHWSEGHEGRFSLAICPRDSDGEFVKGGGVAVISARIDAENIIYTVTESVDSPWPDFGLFGSVMSRTEALEGPIAENLFHIVDAVAANERRLSERILASGLQS